MVLPLLAIVLVFPPAIFSVTAVNDECTFGFLDFFDIDESSADLVTLPDPSLPIEDPLSHFTQWIFPNINFTCSANIASWRLRVNDSIDSRNTWIPSIPQIATWRLQNSFGGSNSYVLHSITNDSQATVTITKANVYEYTPSEPISVQAGDIVSIMMPPNDDKRTKSVRPLFLRVYKGNSSTVSCTRLGNSQHFFLADGMCLNQLQQQFLYIPLLTAVTNEIVATIYSTYLTMAPSPSLGPTPTIINVAPTVTMAHTVSTVRPAQGKDTSSTTRLDKGLVIGSLIAGATLFILAMMSVIIFLAIFCSKQKQAMPTTNGLQQEMLKGSDSVTPHQLQSEDYELLSEMKSKDAYIPNIQQVMIETEDNVAYFNPTESEQYYSNDQCDYEEIEDY